MTQECRRLSLNKAGTQTLYVRSRRTPRGKRGGIKRPSLVIDKKSLSPLSLEPVNFELGVVLGGTPEQKGVGLLVEDLIHAVREVGDHPVDSVVEA